MVRRATPIPGGAPQAAAELVGADRAMRMLRSSNQTLIHASDEDTLLQEARRIAVDDGGYRMAVVAFAERDEAKSGRSGGLVLPDMQLPDIDGLAVLSALRADPATRDLTVIALSASAMPELVTQARAHGAADYWTKPLDFDRFLADMQRLLARSHQAG